MFFFSQQKCVKEILKSDKWKAAMRSFNYSPSKNLIETPMRKLINQMPNCALMIMDRCVIVEDENTDYNKEFEVCFKYDFFFFSMFLKVFFN